MDYSAVDHRNMTDDVLGSFFKSQGFQLHTFPNRQVFDFAGVKGRLLSSSYSPESNDARYEPMLAKLASDFSAHQQNGSVTFEYETKVYTGQL